MFKKILFPINLQDSELADKALQLAIQYAKTPGAELTVLAVAPGFGMPIVAAYFPEDAFQEAMQEISRQLKLYIAAKIPNDIHTIAIVTEGNPAERIIHQANESDSDLIIMPSHDQSMSQVLLGSVAARVVRHAHCSVLTVKGR